MITWGQVPAINHLMVAMAIRSGLWLRPFLLPVSVSKETRDETRSELEVVAPTRGRRAGAKRLRKSKRIGRRGATGIRESKKRVAARPYVRRARQDNRARMERDRS